ncbi:hypothetical protein [Streptomyces marispadix]|uniref:Uncharacterized protein n=1 Tax=Streptomyces marispadix TaxID=2922868 RepID=A0ABS9T024_9ACTN|nr:hypothetical protein [Streptomyces marispadix]MCH6161859.1 hypothetical protein [Streptomyces marispadix]
MDVTVDAGTDNQGWSGELRKRDLAPGLAPGPGSGAWIWGRRKRICALP